MWHANKSIFFRKVLQTIDPMMTLITLWIVGAGFVHLVGFAKDVDVCSKYVLFYAFSLRTVVTPGSLMNQLTN